MGAHESTPRTTGSRARSIQMLIAVVLLAGCTCKVEMEEGWFEPPNLCTGETLTLHYKDGADCLESCEVKSAGGELLGSRDASEGEIVTTRGVQAADLPLNIVGFSQGESDNIRHQPQIIDNPTWTASYYVNAFEGSLDINYDQGTIIWTDTKRYDHDRTEDVCASGDSNCSPRMTVDVWKVYDKIAGYSWTVPDWHYSSRAKAINFDNETNYSMTVTPPGGSQPMTIGPSPGSDWATSYTPWGTWVGMFSNTTNLTEVYLGEYWGDYTTPHKPPLFEEEGMHPVDITHFAEMKLKVKCDQAP